jgi:hypothetical protein
MSVVSWDANELEPLPASLRAVREQCADSELSLGCRTYNLPRAGCAIRPTVTHLVHCYLEETPHSRLQRFSVVALVLL